jgi:hypothetical protein
MKANSLLDDNTLKTYTNVLNHPKVPMSLRVGVAGPRALNASALEAGLTHLTEILKDTSQQLQSFIQNNRIAQQLYSFEHHNRPLLRMTSSLAIGADRLAMSENLNKNLQPRAEMEYAAILPFLLEDCKNGMHESTRNAKVNENDWLELNSFVSQIKTQKKSRLIELDGDITSPETRNKAHFRCTEYLIENIDLLVVLTKKDSILPVSKHLAGTSTTIRLAKEACRPIIEIALDADETGCTLFIHPAKVGATKRVIYSQDHLEQLLKNLVLFDSIFKLDTAECAANHTNRISSEEKLKRESLILNGFQSHVESKSNLTIKNGNVDFDYQGVITTVFTFFQKLLGYDSFDRFKRVLSNNRLVELQKERLNLVQQNHIKDDSKLNEPENVTEAHSWFAHFSRADSLAVRFASIHRSTYLRIYILAALALIFAATALTFQDSKPVVLVLIILEMLTLTSIFTLYKKDHHNHQQWLQNRCLAEALRPNIYLSQFGRCFSFFTNRSNDELMYREIIGHNQSGAQWVCIQAELLNRYIGFSHCRYTPSFIKKSVAFLQSTWVAGQISYHLSNAAKMSVLGTRFSRITHILFFSTCVVLLVKAFLFAGKSYFWPELVSNDLFIMFYKVVSLFTAVLPILGTALFAIRNHSEFDISAQRSLTMLAFFRSLHSAIVAKEDSSSEALDQEFARLTEVSAREVSDWLEIYEVKESEPG